MSRPRIDLLAPPFRGHLHPILGLGRALAEIADVRVLTGAELLPEVAASGLAGHALLRGQENAIASIANPPHSVGSHPLLLARQFRGALAMLARLREELLSLYTHEPPALVIADSVLPVAGFVATELGLPWWTVAASPCALESRSGAPGYLGGWSHRDDAWGRVRDGAGRTIVRLFKRMVFLSHRSQLRALGLTRLYRTNGDEAIYSPELILGLGMTELEFSRRWPAAFHFIGPILYTPPDAAPPLILEPDARHVLVTFGTQLPWIKDAMATASATLARDLPGVVVHFSEGRPGAPAIQAEGEMRARRSPRRSRRDVSQHSCRPALRGVAGRLRSVRPCRSHRASGHRSPRAPPLRSHCRRPARP
jgi:UDP:flavonoid glycosyltransferase YjiC (YdhE family)